MKIAKLNKPRPSISFGRETWIVRFPVDGKPDSQTFETKADAFDFYERKKAEEEWYGRADALKNEDRADAIRAIKILHDYDDTLTLTEVVKEAVARYKAEKSGIPLAKALQEFKDQRKEAGVKDTYLSCVKSRLNRFVQAFPKASTRSISTGDIDAFLKGLKNRDDSETSDGNKAVYRRDIRTFFSYCEAQGYTDKNPAHRATIYTPETPKYEALTPEQSRAILEGCPVDILAGVAMEMFCGIRVEEVKRLRWEAVHITDDTDDKFITVDSNVAKKTKKTTSHRRTVPIPDCAVPWILRGMGDIKEGEVKTGEIMPPNYRYQLDIARARAGFTASVRTTNSPIVKACKAEAKATKRKLTPWIDNIFRHTAISYTLAKNSNIHETATNMGNSPGIIKSNYLKLVKPKDAEAFFAIYPADVPREVNVPASEGEEDDIEPAIVEKTV